MYEEYIAKERARNNLNNYGAGFLFLTKRSQEAHSCSKQRLRSFRQEQKDKLECSSYFMHVPKLKHHYSSILVQPYSRSNDQQQ